MIIVIDGPAGSGKSSTAKALSDRLNIHFLDSGALYRAITYFWVQQGKPDDTEFFTLLPDIGLDADFKNHSFSVYLNGENISEEIRSPEVSDSVSHVASMPRVRKRVNACMRNLVKKGAFIADGRDLGTAVFPDADLKFYMNASIKERARRRFDEMKGKHKGVTLDDVIENLEKRDHLDQNRAADPLAKADDAIVIDTTGKTFEEQVDYMSAIIKDKLNINY